MSPFYTIDEAPRDLEGLKKLSRPKLYRLAMDLGILRNMPPDQQAAMHTMTREEQAPIILQALLAHDANPGAAATRLPPR